MAERRGRNALTLEEKKVILDAYDQNPNASALSKEFDIPRTTIIGIVNAREQIEAALAAGAGMERMRLKPADEPRLEEALVMWLKQARSQNVPIGGDLLRVR